MKNKLIATCSVLFCVIFLSFPCWARDFDPDEDITLSPDAVEVTITADVPDGYKGRIEVYLNGAPRALNYDENLENNGYTMHTELNPGIYGVKVLSSTNIDERYRFEANETFDSRTENSLNIKVIDGGIEDDSDGDHDEHADFVFDDSEPEPNIYDFSNGTGAGTLNISCKTYGAVQSVTYRIVGAESIYDIELNREHGFAANVLLPEGSYYESSSIDVTLDQDAKCPDDLYFQWEHSNNPGAFGSYYDVSNGSEESINDLAILMVYNGEVEELNSGNLFRSTLMDNYLTAQESHIQKELESAFPERYEESETETIAEAIPVENNNHDVIIQVIQIITAIFALFVLIFAVVKIREKILGRKK